MKEPASSPQQYQHLQREARVQLEQHLATMPVDPDRIAQLLQILLNVSELQVPGITKPAKKS